MSRRRVLLVAATTGYQTRSFGAAADALGVDLVLATDRCHVLNDPWGDRAVPVRFEDEDWSAASVVAALRDAPVDGILAVGDRPTSLAARAAADLGLPWHTRRGATSGRDKLVSRRMLAAAGLPVPTFFDASIDDEPRTVCQRAGIVFPCVLKPLAMSGSRGVMRADTLQEFVAAFRRLKSLLLTRDVRATCDPANDHILIESFIPGPEYAIEAVLEHGVLRPIAIFDKPDPLDGPFFEETIYATPSRASLAVQRAIAATMERAAMALGLRHGPVHGECRVNAQGVYVLEAAARPIGGLCARALRFDYRPGAAPPHAGAAREASGPIPAAPGAASLEELLLRHAIGEPLDDWVREAAAAAVMMIPIPRAGVLRAVHGEADARRVRGIVDLVITTKLDEALIPLPEGASYLGFIFATGASTAEVIASVREAHARLRFVVDTPLPMAAPSS